MIFFLIFEIIYKKEAIKFYNEWFEYFHKEKPQKPTTTTSAMPIDQQQANEVSGGGEKTFAERMTHDYQLKQYDDLLARWYSKAALYCERVRAKFIGVLKFPHGGWMCDLNLGGGEDDGLHSEEDDDEEAAAALSDDENMSDDQDDDVEHNTKPRTGGKKQQRREQMHELRKLYLPTICFAMLDTLNKMNMNKELIKLADLVAAKNYKLYDLFEIEQLRCWLFKFADASISLIDANSDYLGYNNN